MQMQDILWAKNAQGNKIKIKFLQALAMEFHHPDLLGFPPWTSFIWAFLKTHHEPQIDIIT